MCGIFGYVGSRTDTADMILDGLKRLEYRGYDSWGIAVKHDKTLVSEKHVGKIGDTKTQLPPSTIGIGHTRWATHGGVTLANAHPHMDCKNELAVMHNGIIENFQELKNELIAAGHIFKSETDTEVMAHLVEENLRTQEFSEAFRNAFNSLKGLNAIIALYGPSEEIIAAKNGSPLLVGIGKDEFFIASDASGIIKYTKNVVFLEDNQMVALGKNLKLFSLPDGQEISPTINHLDWDFEETEKGNYPHFLIKEIHEEPGVLENNLMYYSEHAKSLANLIKQSYGAFMLGCGTASYAAIAGTYLFSKIAKRHINYSIGSEFSYLEDYVTPKTLVIPISQSGETIDVVEPVEKAKKKGAQIAAITNVLGSTLYRQSDYQFLLGAGVEKAVVGTKSFVAMVALLLLTAYTFAGKETEGKELLKKAAKNMTEILTDSYIAHVKLLADKLKTTEHIYIIGRGLSYATTLESTLKIKEASYIHAEGFAGGELKHGVIALIEKGTPCIVYAPNDETYDDILSNAQEIKARGGYIIGIGPKNNPVFDFFLQTADLAEATILPQSTVAHVLAYYLALARHIEDPDKPRNLAKSVTVK